MHAKSAMQYIVETHRIGNDNGSSIACGDFTDDYIFEDNIINLINAQRTCCHLAIPYRNG